MSRIEDGLPGLASDSSSQVKVVGGKLPSLLTSENDQAERLAGDRNRSHKKRGCLESEPVTGFESFFLVEVVDQAVAWCFHNGFKKALSTADRLAVGRIKINIVLSANFEAFAKLAACQEQTPVGERGGAELLQDNI